MIRKEMYQSCMPLTIPICPSQHGIPCNYLSLSATISNQAGISPCSK